MIEALLKRVDPDMLPASGELFYSGREAFNTRRAFYVLGFNPGGHPDSEERSIRSRADHVLQLKTPWSAYLDDGWVGRPAGTSPFQKRVKHLLETTLKQDLRRTPSSNLIFKRSPRIAGLEEIDALAAKCWPFHQAVIDTLKPKAIVCLGLATGQRVRAILGAHKFIDDFTENNKRGWKSTAHSNPSGLVVFSLTHPSVANWTSPASDPGKMVAGVVGDLAKRRLVHFN